MTSTTLTLNLPAVAPAAARLAAGLRHAGLTLWSALEEVGRRRADRELARLASIYGDSHPQLARLVRERAGR